MQKERGCVSEVSRFHDGKIGDIVFVSLVKYEVRKSDEVEVGEVGIVGLRRKKKKPKIHVLESGRAKKILGRFNRIRAVD